MTSSPESTPKPTLDITTLTTNTTTSNRTTRPTPAPRPPAAVPTASTAVTAAAATSPSSPIAKSTPRRTTRAAAAALAAGASSPSAGTTLTASGPIPTNRPAPAPEPNSAPSPRAASTTVRLAVAATPAAPTTAAQPPPPASSRPFIAASAAVASQQRILTTTTSAGGKSKGRRGTYGYLDAMAQRRETQRREQKVSRQIMHGESVVNGYNQVILMPSQDRQGLINMVRCGNPELVDFALQQLLHRSHAGLAVANWKGLLEMCFEVVEAWLDDVEEDATGTGGIGLAGGLGGESDQRHATDVMLLLRNLMDTNPIDVFLAPLTRPSPADIKRRKSLARPRLLSMIERVLGLRALPELALAQPELVLYAIEIVAAIPRRFVDHAPLFELFEATSDLALIMPLIRIFRASPPERLPRQRLLDKILPFTTLIGSISAAMTDDDLLAHSLDLVYHLTTQSTHALAFLRRPDAATWLRSLTTLIDDQSRTIAQYAARKAQCEIEWVPPLALAATGAPYEPQRDGTLIVPVREDDGKPHSQEHLGLGPIIPIPSDRLEELRRTKEIERATAWMKSVIVYQPQSSMTQLTFWSAYREFIQDAASASLQEAQAKAQAQGLPLSAVQPVIPPMANAQEVIKLAQSVFPAHAQVVSMDEQGNKLPASKYLLVGLKFRRCTGRYETFACRWEGCESKPRGAITKPSELQQHLESEHAGEHRCRWRGGSASCSSSSSSKSHLATHVPLDLNDNEQPRGRLVVRHPSTSSDVVRSGTHVTFREPPEPPHPQQLSWRVKQASIEATPDGEPHAGPAYRSAIVLRNLARALKEDLEVAEDQEDQENGGGGTRGKRRKLDRYGAFGLPAPDSILEAAEGAAGREAVLTREERDKAKAAFMCVVEPKALEWVAAGDAIAKKLSDCMGW